MIRLTLAFKGKALKVFQPENGCVKIGRAEDCDITIDNLALSPVHAIITIDGDNARIEDKSDTELDTGVLVNDEKIDSAELKHNDVIKLGKYELKFACLEAPHKAEAAEEPQTTSGFLENRPVVQGWLQFMNGPKLGRTVKLSNSMVRLGKSGKTCAMISTRNGHYYISHLEGEPRTKVCNRDLDNNRLLLKDGDTLQVGETEMLFFLEGE